MSTRKVSQEELIEDIKKIGICPGDTILVTANLGKIGRLGKRAESARILVESIMSCLGEEGTLVSLAYTKGSLIKKPKKEDAFHLDKRSYAGALPNEMIKMENSFRSSHPVCSYVALGKNAEFIMKDHDERSPAYEPVRKIIELKGKCITLGCGYESPGFTTTHLAETDLKMHNKLIFTKKVFKGGFINKNGQFEIYERPDPSLCTENFPTLSGHYLRYEHLKTGRIGDAYTIIGDAKGCYEVDCEILKKDEKFHICKNPDCFQCRLNRWDTLWSAPFYLVRKIFFYIKKKIGDVK